MDWKSAKIPQGGKLYKVHAFNFMYKGNNYHLQIDEYADGQFTGHGEHSADKNFVIESVSGSSINQCLTGLLAKIESRVK